MLLILQALVVGSCLLGLSEAGGGGGGLIPYGGAGGGVRGGRGLAGLGVIYRRKATGRNRRRGSGGNGGNKAVGSAGATRSPIPTYDDNDEYNENVGYRRIAPARYENDPYNRRRDDDDNNNDEDDETNYAVSATGQGQRRGTYQHSKPGYGKEYGQMSGVERYDPDDTYDNDDEDNYDNEYRSGRGEANFYNYVPGFVINPRRGSYASDRYPKLPDVYYKKCFYGGKVQQNCFPYTDYYNFDMQEAGVAENDEESYPKRGGGGDYGVRKQDGYRHNQPKPQQQRYHRSRV